MTRTDKNSQQQDLATLKSYKSYILPTIIALLGAGTIALFFLALPETGNSVPKNELAPRLMGLGVCFIFFSSTAIFYFLIAQTNIKIKSLQRSAFETTMVCLQINKLELTSKRRSSTLAGIHGTLLAVIGAIATIYILLDQWAEFQDDFAALHVGKTTGFSIIYALKISGIVSIALAGITYSFKSARSSFILSEQYFLKSLAVEHYIDFMQHLDLGQADTLQQQHQIVKLMDFWNVPEAVSTHRSQEQQAQKYEIDRIASLMKAAN